MQQLRQMTSRIAILVVLIAGFSDVPAQKGQPERKDEATGAGPVSIASGDLNSDGYPDVVVACQKEHTLNIHFNSSTGGFGEPTTLKTGKNPTGVLVADFNQDKLLDIAAIFYADNQLGVYLNGGHGNFGQPVT